MRKSAIVLGIVVLFILLLFYGTFRTVGHAKQKDCPVPCKPSIPCCPEKVKPVKEHCPPKPHCAPAPVECKPAACIEPQECCTPCQPINPCRPCDPSDWTAQIRGAAFIPVPHQLSKIYGGALPTLELESSYAVCKNRWLSGDQLQLWENVSWITKKGHTIGFGYPTRLNLVPFRIGMSYKINIGRHTDFYFGVGPTFSLLRIKIDTPFQSVHINRNQFGLTTKTGFRFNFCKHYFFDLFGDYYYTQFGKMHNSIQNIDNNFSAFYVGGGFGAKW